MVSAELDGGTSLFDGTSTALVLNATASAIWDELAEPVTVVDLVRRLAERFQVPSDLVRSQEMTRQVMAVLTDLTGRGLVGHPS